MEAARIPWRPLGRLLVEQGLLTADELEHALAEQERTGRRLGETLVDCGFVSGPELSEALAAQYGIELTAETGFGTGLRTVIQQRHESDRGRVVRALPSSDEPFEAPPEAASHEEPAELEATPPEEQSLHAQLEEQWAKLAAAEERLAESHRELTALAHEYDERHGQATRLARRARQARAQLGSDHEQDERIAQLEREVQARGAEIDRFRSECAGLRDELAGVEAATEERVVENHRELAALARQYDRRRGQASRLARRARLAREGLGSQRERDEQIVRLEESVRARDAEIDRLGDVLSGAEAATAERDEQIVRLEETVRARDAEIDRLREALAGAEASSAERDRLLVASGEQLAGKLTTVEQRLAESRRELDSQRERRRSQLARFVGRVRERDAKIERLAADVRGCDEEIQRLRGANDDLRRAHERRRAQAARFLTRLRVPVSETPPAAPAPADNHLLFVQLNGRYELVERDGPPPATNTLLELPELCEGALLVSGLRRSPLPGDVRPCIVAQLAWLPQWLSPGPVTSAWAERKEVHGARRAHGRS